MIDKVRTKIESKITEYLTKKSVLNSIQENNGVLNIHRIDENNTGDFFCAPYHYFKELQDKSVLDIHDFKSSDKKIRSNYINQTTQKSLVIGGGGLLNRESFEREMKFYENLANKGKKVVLWGVGHNSKVTKGYDKIQEYNIKTANFGLVGTRDINMNCDYVPCVSCMHSIFDVEYTEKHEIGVVFHRDTLNNKFIVDKFKGFPTASNSSSLDYLIRFIGSVESVITDSYHVMYWSMLLNKKVAVIPNSSKFFGFKYKPVITDFDNCLLDIKKSIRHDGIKEESRELNVVFSEKVFNYLNI